MKTNKTITLVLTSCNRFDLLEQTIKSFLKFNTYPITKYIFIEDTEKFKQLQTVINKFPEIIDKSLLLNNTPKLGQIKSIDKAYSHVETDYIFHCEEDWEFYKEDFIENSILLLEENPKIINVWLREMNDSNGHPIIDKVYKTSSGIEFKKLETNYNAVWHGFVFNPTVKRTIDYKNIAPFNNIGHEGEIGQKYFELGFEAAIFTEGYVKHSGWHRRVLDADKKRSKIQIELDSWIKKQKASIYKLLGIFGKKYQK